MNVDLAHAAVYYIAFLFSTTLHEAAHAWAAKLGGDLTAYHGGQVTLDPRPHIRREPFGMVVLPLISVIASGWPFGFASAPYDPQWAMRYPKRAAGMAAAGPAANLAIVLITWAMIRVGVASGWFHAPSSVRFGEIVASDAGGVWPGVALVLGVLFSLNLLLATLNLLPLPPLDGSAVVLLFLSDRAATRYQQTIWGNPALSIIGMLIAWQAFGTVFRPLFLAAVNVLHPGAGYH
jgi:Zn-dependent protease